MQVFFEFFFWRKKSKNIPQIHNSSQFKKRNFALFGIVLNIVAKIINWKNADFLTKKRLTNCKQIIGTRNA